jgi:hypothetical protein
MKDYTVWDIDALSPYRNLPEPQKTEFERVSISIHEALFLFLERNGLLTCRVSDDQGNVIKRLIMDSERTEEGKRFCKGSKSAVQRWIGSTGSVKLPPEMNLLETALADVRAEYDKNRPDYVAWHIDELLKMYRKYPDLAVGVEAKYEALFLFLEQNGLLTCRVSDSQGRVVKRFIMNSERTEEGKALCKGFKNAVLRWLHSTASAKIPPDTKALSKALVELRARQGS